MAVIIITHDLGVIAEIADSVVVMYAGRVVERAPVGALFDRPMHPYTEGLLRSIPPLDRDLERLPTIAGTVPAPQAMPTACRYAPRCSFARAACNCIDPALVDVNPGHSAACLRHTEHYL